MDMRSPPTGGRIPREIDALKAELKEQRALIQAVNDKVELNKPAPQRF